MPLIGSGLIQAANTFVGAYDAIPSIAAAYSTRRLLSSYTGPLLRLVADRTGYPEQDIGYTAAGDLNTAAAASFLAGDAGYIAKWYDQSGNALHWSQATLASMPLFVVSGQNSRPIIRADGTDDHMLSPSFAAMSSETIIAVVKWSTVGNKSLMGRDPLLRMYGGPMDYIVASGWTDGVNGIRSATTFGTNFGILTGARTVSGNSITLWKNSSTVLETNTITQSSVASVRVLFRREIAANDEPMDGDLGELIICNAALSTANRNAAESAANAYWSAY